MAVDSGTYDDATLARQKMAAALLGQTLQPEEVKHWAQGLANMGKAALGGYMGYQANQEAKQEREQGNADLYKSLGLPPPVVAGADPSVFSKIGSMLSGGGSPAPDTAAPPAPGIPSDQASYAPPPAPGPAPTTFRPGITAPAGPMSPPVVAPPGKIYANDEPSPLDPQAGNLPRGLRNNNPLNIEAGSFTQGQPGFVGSDGRFAKFEAPEQGVAAANKLLDSYQAKGLNTPAAIIGRWAPQGENNSAAYAATVAKKLGIGPNDPITPEMRPALIAAMSEVENGQPAAPQAPAAAGPPAGPSAAPQIATALTAPTGAPTDVSAQARPPAVSTAPGFLQGVPIEKKAQIAQMLTSRNPQLKALGQTLLTQAMAASDTPKYDFKTAGDSLYRTNAKTGTAEPVRDVGRSVKPMSDDERKQWKVPEGVAAGIDDNGKPVFSQPSNINTVSPVVSGINDRFDAQQKQAQAAPQIISSIHEARRAIDAGVITGAGADTKLMLAKIGTTFGLPSEAVANTEVARASLGNQVLESAKTLGANPSNTDRDYIEKVKGGSILLEESSMRRLLDMQEKWARDSVKRSNTSAEKLVQTDPEKLGRFAPMLKVDEPPTYEDYVKNNPAKAAAAAPAAGSIRKFNPATGKIE